MEYVRVDSIEEAKFWIPTYDERYRHQFFKNPIHFILGKLFGREYTKDSRITLGKPYKLFESSDGEIAIIDDLGNDINLWLCHKGYFVKETN